jgi:hypothetical protein
MSVVLVDYRQGELRKVGRLTDVLVAVGPVHYLRSYASRLECQAGEALRLLVSGVAIGLAEGRVFCAKCGEWEGEDLYSSGEGLLCYTCFVSEFGHVPTGEPVEVDA